MSQTVVQKKVVRTVNRYRLLAGSHSVKMTVVDEDGKPITTGDGEQVYEYKIHRWNDPESCIVESDIDLVLAFGREKFENLDGPNTGKDSNFMLAVEAEVKRRLVAMGLDEGSVDEAASKALQGVNETKSNANAAKTKKSVFERVELEAKTVAQLQNLCTDSGIEYDLTDKKAELINTILAAT